MPFLSGYARRKSITIQNANVDSDLTDFPVLVKITADSDIGAAAHVTGQNIRFTSSDGTTLLKYERQSFAVSLGAATAVFWVKVPTVTTASGTVIYIYYDNSAASDGQDTTNVYDSNVSAIHHFEQDPSGSAPQMYNSKTGTNTGTSSGSMTSGDLVTGQIGSGLDFDGTNDYIASSMAAITGYPFQMGCWVKPASTSDGRTCLSLGKSLTEYASLEIRSGKFSIVNRFDTVFTNATGTTSPSNGTWYRVDGVWDSTTSARLFVNGVQEAIITTSKAFATPVEFIAGAARTVDAAGAFSGLIDEPELHKAGRSDAWIKFRYRNMFESDNELTWGSQESSSSSHAPQQYYHRQMQRRRAG